MSLLSAGARAPDFELQTRDGQRFRLTEALGRGPVILVFYKSSCPTSQFTFPYIQKIFAGARDAANFTIWGISQDDVVETQLFVDQQGITFDVLIDEHPYAVSASYGLEFVPTIFIVDSNGEIRLSDFGFSKATLNEVARMIAERAKRPAIKLFSPDDKIPEIRPG